MSTASGSRIAIVEAMRGLAAIAVACNHFSLPLSGPLPEALTVYGWLGVDVFFVISGFVIPLSLHGRNYRLRDFPNYLLRRLIRLEPPYIASILFVIVLWHASAAAPQYAGSAPDYSLAQIFFHLLYLIPLTNYAWLADIYWSLAYEFVFYIVVGLTFSLLIDRRSVATLAVIVIICTAFFYLQNRFSLDSQLTVGVMEFGVGVLLMRLVVDKGWHATAANHLWLVICLAFVFYDGGTILGMTVLASVCAIYLLKSLRLGRWAFGSISYSLYLTPESIGGRVLKLGRRWGEGALYEIALIGMALAGSIAFAIVFAFLIEGPSRRAARRIS